MIESEQSLLIGLLIVCSSLVGLAAIVGGIWYARGRRLLEHAERMKALETGRELPVGEAAGDGEGKGSSGRCYSVASHACFWGFILAVGAASKDGGGSPGAAYAIASAAGAVSVTAVICGTVLAYRPPSPSPEPSARPVKVHFDPEGA